MKELYFQKSAHISVGEQDRPELFRIVTETCFQCICYLKDQVLRLANDDQS